MTLQRATELMKTERTCVERANTCGRDCAKCVLVQEDEELIAAYDMTIKCLEFMGHLIPGLEALDDIFTMKEENCT